MDVIHVSPHGGQVTLNGETFDTERLSEAIRRVAPGQTIELLPGTYLQPVELTRSGEPGRPIRLKARPGALLHGMQSTGASLDRHGAFRPDTHHFAFVRLTGVRYVVLQNLDFAGCWPVAIMIRGSRDITIERCTGRGGRFFVYARNRIANSENVKARDITLRAVHWIQDPHGKMWSGRISWRDVKGRTEEDHSYLNGALFGSYDIRGGVTLENCVVQHAFNVIRMKCKSPKLKRRRNMNVRIFGCRFEYVRDNAIEPEVSALNWWVHDNDIVNAHAPFSLHGISGGYWYVFGNRIGFDSVPADRDHTGGQIFKLYWDPADDSPFPRFPWYVFHNSFYLRSHLAKDGETRRLTAFNNVIEFCRDGAPCNPHAWMLGSPTKPFRWHASYDFGGNLSNYRDFPDGFIPVLGVEMTGIRTDRLLRAPTQGDFSLQAGSPALGAGVERVLQMPSGSPVRFGYGLDAGALHQGAPVPGPIYTPLDESQVEALT